MADRLQTGFARVASAAEIAKNQDLIREERKVRKGKDKPEATF